MRWRSMYVAATGIELPERRVSLAAEVAAGRYDPEEAANTEMVEYARSEDGRSSLEYAAAAAGAAIEATPAGFRHKLQALYHTHVGPPGGPPAWNPAGKIHQLLDLDPGVLPFGLTNGCAMGLAAVQEACFRLTGGLRPSPGSVAVVGSEVWPPSLVDPLTSSRGLVLADGAGAVVVSNVGGFAEIRSTAARIDSRLSDATRGGESLAFDPSAVVNLGDRFDHFVEHEIDATTYREMRDKLINEVLAEALGDAGLTPAQINAFVFTHSGARNLRNGYFRLLPIAQDAVNTAAIGHTLGHLGTADWFVGLHLLREHRRLNKGDYVLMIGGAGGWTEAAVVLRMIDP